MFLLNILKLKYLFRILDGNAQAGQCFQKLSFTNFPSRKGSSSETCRKHEPNTVQFCGSLKKLGHLLTVKNVRRYLLDLISSETDSKPKAFATDFYDFG